MHLVLGDQVPIDQLVRTNCSPLDRPVVPANLDPQMVRSLLVVPMQRQQQTNKPDDTLLAERNRLVEIAVAVASCDHEHHLGWVEDRQSVALSAHADPRRSGCRRGLPR